LRRSPRACPDRNSQFDSRHAPAANQIDHVTLRPGAAALAMATNTLRVFLRSPSKLGSQRDGRPAQVVDVTLRPRFVFELCAPRRCHASDHGASGIRLPGLGRGFDDGDALALEDGCFLLGIQLRSIPNEPAVGLPLRLREDEPHLPLRNAPGLLNLVHYVSLSCACIGPSVLFLRPIGPRA